MRRPGRPGYRRSRDPGHRLRARLRIASARHRHLTRRLRESEAFLPFLREAPLPMVLGTRSGRILVVNRVFEEATGFTLGELDRATPASATWRTAVSACFRSQASSNESEVLVRSATGEERHWTLYTSAVAGPRSVTDRRLCIAVDVTTRNRAQHELERAREQAETASRAKSEFLANISHEIRTPMTAILGYADVLMTRLEDPLLRECVSTIQRNGDFLLEIINDLLDLSSIEARRIDFEFREISPHAIARDVIAMMRVRAEEKRLPLEVEFPTPLPERIRADSKRLRQILLNLLGNAIKFTQRGRIRLVVTHEIKDEKPLVRFDVIDTGVGIPPRDVQRLFEPFVRGDDASHPRQRGTGLGLTISRRLAELQGGEILASSEKGVGSVFGVRIPVGFENVRLLPCEAEPPPPTPSPLEEPCAQGLDGNLLLVDDDPEARELVRRILEDVGIRVHCCASGDRALAVLQEEEPDAIVLDMQMPGLSGYETARRLRESGYLGPIVALTAAAMRGDRSRCLSAGCSDYLSKPIRRTSLVEVVAKALTKPPVRGRRRVLVIEDDESAREALLQLLEARGFEALGASTARNALERISEFEPEVCLVDLDLPDMHGLELLRRIPPGIAARVRFIALSGTELPETSGNTGFDGHFLKPLRIDHLDQL